MNEIAIGIAIMVFALITGVTLGMGYATHSFNQVSCHIVEGSN